MTTSQLKKSLKQRMLRRTKNNLYNEMRTHSVLPAEVIDGAHIRALHLFESSLILNQESGTGSGVPETSMSSTLIKLTINVTSGIFKLNMYTEAYSLIRCYTVFDVSLLQGLQGFDDSKQLCHVVIPSETG